MVRCGRVLMLSLLFPRIRQHIGSPGESVEKRSGLIRLRVYNFEKSLGAYFRYRDLQMRGRTAIIRLNSNRS